MALASELAGHGTRVFSTNNLVMHEEEDRGFGGG
jgi:hypothetical protein